METLQYLAHQGLMAHRDEVDESSFNSLRIGCLRKLKVIEF